MAGHRVDGGEADAVRDEALVCLGHHRRVGLVQVGRLGLALGCQIGAQPVVGHAQVTADNVCTAHQRAGFALADLTEETL